MQDKFEFHLGFYDHLHSEPSVNFEMNRWINYLGLNALHDMEEISPRLSDLPSYRREFLSLGEEALSQGRDLEAAYYLRSAEFFMREQDPDKEPTRNRFLRLISKEYGIAGNRFAVPYQDGDVKGSLPAYYFPQERPRGNIVIHGGYDSYIEEFYPLVLPFRRAGYSVVCFEGPGQGGALLESHLLLTHEWHKPVKAVLDYFQLANVTLIGISFGACLALRAAALEPRVERVIAYDVFLDWLDTTCQKLKPIAPMLLLLLNSGASGPFNGLLNGIMNKSALFDWAMHQAYLVLGASTPYQVFQKSKAYTTRDISPQLRQDVLILAGSEDHIVPSEHYHQQLRILSNARSVTGRVFTRADQAQNHCQIGNLRLAVDFILSWIEFQNQHAAC